MRVVTYNINGIRASGRKGIENWLIQTSPEIVCFQEVRASEQQLRQVLFNFLLDYELFFNPGNRAGYSGVAVLIKKGFILPFHNPKNPKRLNCYHLRYHQYISHIQH